MSETATAYHPYSKPAIQRRQLTQRQREVLGLIEAYYQEIHEGCPVTYIAKRLGLHHETVRECVQTLFARGLVVGPGSPITPSEPIALPAQTPRGPSPGSFVVYFVLNPRTRLIKIGRSLNFEQRIKTVQRDAGSLVILIGCVASDDMTEQKWHRRFASARVKGEWFTLTTEVRDELAARFGIDVTHWMCDPPAFYQI